MMSVSLLRVSIALLLSYCPTRDCNAGRLADCLRPASAGRKAEYSHRAAIKTFWGDRNGQRGTRVPSAYFSVQKIRQIKKRSKSFSDDCAMPRATLNSALMFPDHSWFIQLVAAILTASSQNRSDGFTGAAS